MLSSPEGASNGPKRSEPGRAEADSALGSWPGTCPAGTVGGSLWSMSHPWGKLQFFTRTVGAKIRYLLLDRGSKGKIQQNSWETNSLLTPQKGCSCQVPFRPRDRGPQGCVLSCPSSSFLLPHLSLYIPHSFKMIRELRTLFYNTKHDKNISLDKHRRHFHFSVFLFLANTAYSVPEIPDIKYLLACRLARFYLFLSRQFPNFIWFLSSMWLT